MGSTLKVDNIVGTSGTSAPITLSGDTATLGSGVAMAANHSGVKTALNASGTAPIYACRAWVNFNGSGTVAIRGSGNVTDITDNGTGHYTVNFTTDMPDANYCVVITHENIDYGGSSWLMSSSSVTTSSVQVASYDIAGTKYQDTDVMCVAIFR